MNLSVDKTVRMADETIAWKDITSIDDSAPVISEWRDFIDRPDVQSGFFCDPEVLADRLRRNPSLSLQLAVLSSENRVQAYIPLLIKNQRVSLHFGPIRLGAMRMRYAEMTDYEFPRVTGSPSGGVDAASRLFERMIPSLMRRSSAPDFLLVESVTARQVDESTSQRIHLGNIQKTYIAELASDFETYWQRMTSKQRWRIKNDVRRFEERWAEAWQIACFRNPDEMEDLKRILDDIHAKSWQGAAGGGGPPSVALLEALAARGWVRSYVLSVSGQPVAFILGYQRKGVYEYAATAYDAAWREYAPGIVLLNHMFKDLHGHDRPERVDFGFGYNDYKKTFGTTEDPRGVLRLGLTRRGRAFERMQSGLDSFYQVVHQRLSGTRLFKRLRQRHRRVK